MFWRSWKKIRDSSRVSAELAVAVLLINRRREALLIVRDGMLTVLTGNMDREKDQSLFDTAVREAKEELWKNSLDRLEDDDLFRSMAKLGTAQRNIDTDKSKSFEIFCFWLTKKASDLVCYEEKGQRGQLWVKPPVGKDLDDLPIIRDLAKDVLREYAKKFLSRRKGGDNGSAGKNFSQERELEKSEIS